MNYALLIKQLRNKMIITQQELAEHLGTSTVTISRWESGKYEPTIKMKRKLKALFIKEKILEETN